jgi:hypothetical protein
MNENEFWLKCWALVTSTILGVAVVMAAISIHADNKIVEMVDKGVDPIKARCAIHGSGGYDTAICVLVAQGLPASENKHESQR